MESDGAFSDGALAVFHFSHGFIVGALFQMKTPPTSFEKVELIQAPNRLSLTF